MQALQSSWEKFYVTQSRRSSGTSRASSQNVWERIQGEVQGGQSDHASQQHDMQGMRTASQTNPHQPKLSPQEARNEPQILLVKTSQTCWGAQHATTYAKRSQCWIQPTDHVRPARLQQNF